MFNSCERSPTHARRVDQSTLVSAKNWTRLVDIVMRDLNGRRDIRLLAHAPGMRVREPPA
jgi:hypothetical protein